MNILIINHYAGSPGYGMEYRPYYLGKEFLRKSNKVRIISANYSHLRRIQPIYKHITLEMVDGIEYYWIPTSKYTANGFKRFMNICEFLIKLYKISDKISKEFKPDVVISSSTYPMDIWISKRIAKISKSKLIYELHDLWPLSLIELANMNKLHPFVLLCKISEYVAYKSADYIVSLLPNIYEYIKYFNISPSKIKIIPNGISIQEWELYKESLSENLKIELQKIKESGKFIIAYTGAHGKPNALNTIIEAAEMSQDKPFHYFLVGNGTEKQNLMELVNIKKLKNVTFWDTIKKNQISDFLNYIDVAVNGLQNKPIFKYGVSPNKILDYMMAQKPIVFGCNTKENLVEYSNCGFTIMPESPLSLLKAIETIYKMEESERKNLGNRGRIFVENNCDYDVISDKFIEILNE